MTRKLLVVLLCAAMLFGAYAEGLIVERGPIDGTEALDEAVHEINEFEISRETAPGTYDCADCGINDTMEAVSNEGDFEIVNGVLVKYTGAGGEVVIPEGVIGIGVGAFYNCNDIVVVVIPNTVRNIGGNAFYSCDNLQSVRIPGSVEKIDYFAFEYCTSLQNLMIEDGVKSIGPAAFGSCRNLRELTIPSSVDYIGDLAFEGCQCISVVDIKSTTIRIENRAFNDCYALTTFYTICETPATKWARGHGYNVVTTDHVAVIDSAVAATCTTVGKTEGKHCSVCNTVLVAQEVVPAKGHSEVIDPAVDATCTAAGKTEGKHCSVCNAVLVAQQVVPATGHTPVIDKAIEATYTKTGKTAGSHCSVCGEVLQEQKVVPELVAKKVKLNSKKATLTVGKTLQLKATLTPAHKTAGKVKLTWTTSDPKVATVTAKGKVKAVGAGKATITVVTPNGKKATCKITVKGKK